MNPDVHRTPYGWQAVPGSKRHYTRRGKAVQVASDIRLALDPNITPHIAASLLASATEVVEALLTNPVLPLINLEDPLWPRHVGVTKLGLAIDRWDFDVPEDLLRRIARSIDQMPGDSWSRAQFRDRFGTFLATQRAEDTPK